MGLTVVTPPTSEPLDIRDVKDHIPIDDDVQDGYIESLMTVAREYVERTLGRPLGETTYKLELDAFPCATFRLPRPPLISITSVKYINASGTQITLDPSSYLVDASSQPARISPAFGASWPATQPRMNAVEVVFVAGFTTATLPTSLKHAMKLIIGHYFRNREGSSDKPMTPLPMAVDALLSLNDYGRYP